MNEQIIKFIDGDVDGCGTDIVVLATVLGPDVTNGTISRVSDAINDYKSQNEGEWDTDGCLDVAKEQLNKEGYIVEFVSPVANIYF